MISQNRLRIMAMKADFSSTGKKYKDALKYYGYANDSSPMYPIPVLKNSRTLTKQASLPRLPVPHLETSINKYLTAVRPLLNEDEFENTKKIASEFIKSGGLGEKLQKLLVEKSKTTENWLAQWWYDKVYLEPRYSILINVNPASLYPHVDYKTLDEQLIFATKYICGFLDFKKYLEDQKLPEEKMGDAYLCMDQYYKLIGSCRIPKKEKDLMRVMQSCSIDLEKTNHVTVMHNNRIFSLQVIDPKTGLSFSASEIFNNLKKLVQLSNEENKIPISLLTGENRDIWSESYSKLCKIENNRKNFESINDSLFVLCLDTKDSVADNSIDVRSRASGQILHGNKSFTSNRWFDKTIQVIIGANGIWGTNFEHTLAEGVPHTIMNDYIYKYILGQNFDLTSEESSNRNCFKELNFDVPTEIQNQIEKSKKSIFSQIDNLDIYILHFEAFGKNFPKSQKISPDAFVQIAAQLAYYRAYKSLGNAYESGSLRKFSLGRTEIIRACSSDTAEFVKSMTNESYSSVDKAKLLLKAINAHRLYTVNVLNCESFDRHLLGLKLTALENGFELPEIYNDIAFKKICHYFISSSQISSKFDSVTSFGPAVDDGYGMCYNITETKLIFGLSCYKSCPTTNSKMFGQHISNALLDCQNLLLKVNSKL